MKLLKGIGKTILAGVTAVGILSLLMCFYSLTPIHHTNTKGNTDYVWTPNSLWVKLTEGISWGKFDSAGFNNPAVLENPDIVILGSSHMEGINVFYRQTLCARLQEALGDRYSVYNLGMSHHNFYRISQYLPNNLSIYDTPPKIAVLETSKVTLTEELVDQILNREIEPIVSHDTGVIATLQKVPFCRVLYQQLELGLLDLFLPERGKTEAESSEAEELYSDAAYDRLFRYFSDLEAEYGTQIVIFYHPTGTLEEDGGISFPSDRFLESFTAYAARYGIDFIDMTAAFEEMYYNDHLVAHGFVTGQLCAGHINANGHAAVAEEIVALIEKMEREGSLCR